MKLLLLPLSAAVAAIPTFHINLDLPPEKRWTEVTERFREEGLAMLRHMRSVLNSKFNHEEVREWVVALKSSNPQAEEYKAELAGIAKDLGGSDEIYDSLLLYNSVYELQFSTACSGILAADPGGTVTHGRNLDFRFVYEGPDGKEHDWPNLTLNEVFWRNGQQLVTTTNFAFFNGFHTALRFDGYTVEQNTRPGNDHVKNLAELKSGGLIFGWAIRNYMETIPQFEDALAKIQETHWAAPQYFIMAGAGPFEGAVVSADRGATLATTPKLQRLRNESGSWHLLQTNDDVNGPALDARRPFAQMTLSGQKQEDVGTTWMWRNILLPGLRNFETVFTWVSVPKTGYWSATLCNESAPVLAQMARPKMGATKWARRALLAGL